MGIRLQKLETNKEKITQYFNNYTRKSSAFIFFKNWSKNFSSLSAIVVDEWHELLGSKEEFKQNYVLEQ